MIQRLLHFIPTPVCTSTGSYFRLSWSWSLNIFNSRGKRRDGRGITIAYDSTYNLTSGHLLFHGGKSGWPGVLQKLFPLGEFSSLLSFKTTLKCDCNELTHLYTKHKLFSPPLAGHTRFPIEPQGWAERGAQVQQFGFGVGNPGCLLMHFACALGFFLCLFLDITFPNYLFTRPAQPCASWVY